MLDLNTCPPTPPSPSPAAATAPAGGEGSKFKTFIGRTPTIGILKSKFLTVLGNSNELLNGISNKLALSISSSDSEYCDDDEEDLPKFDDTIDYTKIDYESRRLKARRAHEEIISGRYRYPNLVPTPRLQNVRAKARSVSSSPSSSSSSSSSLSHSWQGNTNNNNNIEQRSYVSSTTRSNSIESRHSGGYGRPGRAIAGARRSDLDIQKDLVRINDFLNTGTISLPHSNITAPHIDVQPPTDKDTTLQYQCRVSQATESLRGDSIKIPASTSATSMWIPPRSRTSNSSTLTSLRDDPELLAAASPSAESTEWRSFIRSESQNSVPSWASSISLDCRTGEEPVKDFMKRFTDELFSQHGAAGIDLELKSEFGAMVRLEIGRQWFTRFLFENKSKSRRVDETTFHALIQYTTIVLFECNECQDFAPAAVIMNVCFAFYREIEVPGCDAYREYIFTFLRQQPIWQSLRFWNAAFFDAVQNEFDHRLATKKRRIERRQKSKEEVTNTAAVDRVESSSSSSYQQLQYPHQRTQQQQQSNTTAVTIATATATASATVTALSTSMNQNTLSNTQVETNATEKEQLYELRMRESIAFRQLCAFTNNMHSLGVPQDMCLEFLKKQSLTLNLPKNKVKIVRDSVNRIYLETELWGQKDI